MILQEPDHRMPAPARRAVLRCLALGGLGLLTGRCGGKRQRVIGVVPQGLTHLFWQTIHAGAVAAAQESGAAVQWSGAATETDYNGQLQIVDAMINRRVDAIVLAPVDRKILLSAVDRAMSQKIPVIIFDSGIEGENYTAWVATDNYGAGAMAAGRVIELLNGKGRIAIVAVRPGVASSVAREAGFEDRIKKEAPGIQIVDQRFGMADFAKSLAVTENILTAHPDLDALFASNESSTVGAMQALKSRASKTKLVGFDWSPNLIEELRSGLVDSLVAQDPFRIGYESVKSALAAIEGRPVQKVQHLPARLLRKADLDLPEVQKLLNPDLKKYLG